MELISVIIPTLNEGGFIEGTLQSLSARQGLEIIVVDGASTDDTVRRAERHAHRVIQAPRGRAAQMNAGAMAAAGEILFFLHADCTPPPGAMRAIRQTLSAPQTIAGAFNISIQHKGMTYRIIEGMANLRSRLLRVPYGDQGLFMRRRTFQDMGGFKEMPLMEDIEMGGRLKRLGRIEQLSTPISISPRRWLAEGPAYTTLRNWFIALAYTAFGIPPARLARLYKDARH